MPKPVQQTNKPPSIQNPSQESQNRLKDDNDLKLLCIENLSQNTQACSNPTPYM